MPLALSPWSAATAASTVSPATKRAARRRASPLPRMKPKMRDCSLSHRRPARIIRCGASAIELRVSTRLLLWDVARREARAQPLGETLQLPDETARAEVVGVTERAAAERRKAEAEHGGDVAVARARDDTLPHRAGRFVEHRQDEPLDGLRRSRAAVRLRADEPVHGGGDASLLPPSISIKPLSRLASEPT